jgi:hypothetical protein
MIKSTRDRRAMLRTRRRDNRPPLTERRRIALLATTTRRPRSLGTYLLAAGVPVDDIPAVAGGLRDAARRMGVSPALRTPVARQIAAQPFRVPSRMTGRYTRNQVRAMINGQDGIRGYRPRIAQYQAAVSQLSSALAA